MFQVLKSYGVLTMKQIFTLTGNNLMDFVKIVNLQRKKSFFRIQNRYFQLSDGSLLIVNVRNEDFGSFW